MRYPPQPKPLNHPRQSAKSADPPPQPRENQNVPRDRESSVLKKSLSPSMIRSSDTITQRVLPSRKLLSFSATKTFKVRCSVFKGLFDQDPARKLTEKEIDKMRVKAQKLKVHLEKVGNQGSHQKTSEYFLTPPDRPPASIGGVDPSQLLPVENSDAIEFSLRFP